MIARSLSRSMSSLTSRSMSGRASRPYITGTAFPGETLTSTMARQWLLNGVAISGQTGASYVVRVNDIGGVVTQQDSNSVTVWHPKDLPGVSGVYLPNFGLLNASATAATDGQAVATWQDQSGLGYHLTQATAGSRPLAQINEVNGNSTVQFDGSDDMLDFPAGSLSAYQNKNVGYMLAAIMDTSPSGGGSTHTSCVFRTATGAARIGLFSVLGSSQNFAAGARRLDADSLVSAAAVGNTGYHVVGNESLWGSGEIRIRVDGTQRASAAFTGSGATSNTASDLARVGGSSVAGQYFPGHVAALIIASPATAWTATQRSQMERYLGLLIGLNIPLQ